VGIKFLLEAVDEKSNNYYILKLNYVIEYLFFKSIVFVVLEQDIYINEMISI